MYTQYIYVTYISCIYIYIYIYIYVYIYIYIYIYIYTERILTNHYFKKFVRHIR